MVIKFDVLATQRVQLCAVYTNLKVKGYDLGIEPPDGRALSDEALDGLYLLDLTFYTGVRVLRRFIFYTIDNVAGQLDYIINVLLKRSVSFDRFSDHSASFVDVIARR